MTHITDMTYTELNIAGGGDPLLISKDGLSLVKMSSTLVKMGVNRLRPA